jgi:hypothetical protein
MRHRNGFIMVIDGIVPTLAIFMVINGGSHLDKRRFSPNDVQHLAHEVWNAAQPGELTSRELRAALIKILGDITPMAEAWIEKLTRNQTRVLLATALHDELGYATEAFLSVAGVAHRSAVMKSLKPCLEGADPLVEKVGSRLRVRNRFLRLWLCTKRS